MQKFISTMFNKLYLYGILLLSLILISLPSSLFSQNTTLSDKTLRKYLPDNLTGYIAIENSTLIIPMQYGKIAARYYTPIGMGDNSTNNNDNNTNTIRLTILNFNKLDSRSSINSDYLNDNQTANSNTCNLSKDNVTIQNYTGTLLSDNCSANPVTSIYVPIVAQDNYLLAVHAQGTNANDLISLLNSLNLNELAQEKN
jgi:hypothetical protein